jgi:hypothetical protein
MARRARKYYLGLGTITQKVADLSDGGNGDTILSNAAIVMLLKQKAETIDVAAERFRLTADERQFLLAADKGEGQAKHGLQAELLQCRRVSPGDIQPATWSRSQRIGVGPRQWPIIDTVERR